MAVLLSLSICLSLSIPLLFEVADIYEGMTKDVSAHRIRNGYGSGAALGLSNFIMFNCYALLFWWVGGLVSKWVSGWVSE